MDDTVIVNKQEIGAICGFKNAPNFLQARHKLKEW